MCSSEQWNNGAFLSFGYGVVATEIGLESNQGLGGTERSIKISHRQPHVHPEHPICSPQIRAPTRLFDG